MPENADADAVEIVEIAREIERYLAAHPRAADSVDGILRWWLLRQRYEQSLRKVQQALEYLVANGSVAKRVMASGEALYQNAAAAPPKS